MPVKTRFILLFLMLIPIQGLLAQEADSALLKSINHLNNLGFDYQMEGRLDSAEYFLLNTLELKEAYYGPNSPIVAYTHINLASIYRSKLDYKVALEHLNLAESILKSSLPDYKFLAYIYHNKGNIYFTFEDYAESSRYYQYAIEILKRIDLVSSKEFEYISLSYYNSLIMRKMFISADSLINSIQKINFSPAIKFNKHYSLSTGYSTFGLEEKALEELKQAEAALHLQEYETEDYLRLYSRFASIYTELNQMENARSALYKNLALIQQNSQFNHRKIIFYYYKLAYTYIKEQNYTKGLEISEDAIIKILKELDELSLSNSPKYSSIIKNRIQFLYIVKAKAALGIFRSTDDKTYLDLAYESYTEAVDKLNQSRLNMKNEESILLSTEEKISIFHDAIDVAVELYNLTGNIAYLEQSFEYTENSKSFALLTEIKGIEAMKFSDIPIEIKEKDEMFNREISAYEELLYNEQINKTPDSLRLSNFEDKLFHLRDDYNTLMDDIENNYPNYFQLKYNPHFTSLEEVGHNLRRNEALVEYVLSDTVLTTYIVDHEQTRVLQHTIDTSFAGNCKKYYDLLESQKFDQDVHATYREYVGLSKMFYETLVAPVRAITDKKEITFVPDGELMYLPFESFITQDVDNEYIDYKDLPYLIHELSIAYSYSSTLLFSERLQSKSPEKKVLAFAPSYDNLMNKTDPLHWNRNGNPDLLIPLLGAKEEVNYISKRVSSEVFMDNDATEYNFKKYASDYSILHLAMHTIINDENPMFSRLAFTRVKNDTLEDNNLYTYEIYNMKLNASMIVLSSCSSGYGKMQRGEGLMSLSRGFMYAGCPSIVMTLWQVSDRSSSELMSSFYKYLKRGKSKKEALRLSKIDYINSSDGLKANPYFWSGFVQIGDSTALYRKSASFYLVILLVSFMGFVLFFKYKGKIKKMLRK